MAVQGFLASLVLDSNDITLMITSYSLPRAKTILNVSVQDRSGVEVSIPGMQSGRLSIEALLDSPNLKKLEASWLKETTVTFVLTVEEGLGTDASWSGAITMGDFTVGGEFGDQWNISISGDISGVVTPVDAIP
jgi:hypothetical protein